MTSPDADPTISSTRRIPQIITAPRIFPVASGTTLPFPPPRRARPRPPPVPGPIGTGGADRRLAAPRPPSRSGMGRGPRAATVPDGLAASISRSRRGAARRHLRRAHAPPPGVIRGPSFPPACGTPAPGRCGHAEPMRRRRRSSPGRRPPRPSASATAGSHRTTRAPRHPAGPSRPTAVPSRSRPGLTAAARSRARGWQDSRARGRPRSGHSACPRRSRRRR